MGGSRDEACPERPPAPLVAINGAPVADELLQHLLRNIDDAVVVVRVDVDPPIVVAASAAQERLVRRQLVGRPLGQGEPQPVRDYLVHTFRRAAKVGTLHASGGWVDPTGEELRIGATLSAVSLGDERYVVGRSYDADGSVAAGPADPMVLETLLASAAIDRRRVAQDLHDDTVQVLSAVTVELELLRRRDEANAAWLGTLRDHLQAANERIRNMVADLDPGVSARAALGSALSERLGGAAHQAGVTLDIVDRLTEPLPEAVAGALYWIATESVFNALRHASCERIEVALEPAPDGVVLYVRDCGIGFDPSLPARSGHYGLVSMRARAQQLGGSLAITSSAARGTKIGVWVPLPGGPQSEPGAPVGHADGVGAAETGGPTAADMGEMVRAIRRVDADAQLAWASSPIGVLLCDATGIVTRANPAAGRRLGLDHQALIGQPLLDCLAPDMGGGGLRAALRALLAGRHQHRRGTAIVAGADGARWPVRYHVQALPDPDGPPWELLVTIDEL